MGVIPLVIASGAGSEMRQAIGIAVFAGMLGVTSFGLFLTPVFFVAIETWLARLKQHPDYSPAPVSPALSVGKESPRA
jgi:Cu/Ag efflux pump CusA